MSAEPLSGHTVLRIPEELRLHPRLEELCGVIFGELSDAANLDGQTIPQPIFITKNGTILAEFGQWRLAIIQGLRTVNCIEYSLSNEESLEFILCHHQPKRAWNAFVRIALALTLEPYLQEQALQNMRAGG